MAAKRPLRPAFWIGLLSSRYLNSRRREKGPWFAVLTLSGLALGTMTLIAVLAVMNGFQMGFKETILELGSAHLQLEPGLDAQEREELALEPRVAAVTQWFNTQGLVRGSWSGLRGAFVRGVEPDWPERDPGLARIISFPEGSWDLRYPDQALVGTELARVLGLLPGDRLQILSLGSTQGGGLAPTEYSFTVSGLFKTGSYDFDSAWILVNLDSARDLLGAAGQEITAVKLHEPDQDGAAAAAWADTWLQGRQVRSWKQINQAFFGALRLEKNVMMILVALIFLVVGFNIYHNLKRAVLEREEELGVLLALGARPLQLRLLFLTEGAWLGLSGALLGTVLGLPLSFHINSFLDALDQGVRQLSVWWRTLTGLGGEAAVFSSRLFYLDAIPVRPQLDETLFVAALALSAALAAAWSATSTLRRIKPVEVLRNP